LILGFIEYYGRKILRKDKQNIIIAGYPKSGNTWITRLTAELIGCPVKGFWMEKNNNEIAVEGDNRKSNYQCFKSHHLYGELSHQENLEEQKIIYVIRDPRDIAISGANYFSFFNHIVLEKLSRELMRAEHPILLAINNRTGNKSYRTNQMINKILNGDGLINSYFNLPWGQQIKQFIHPHVLNVRYEDVITDPYKQATKILSFIGVKKNEDEILTAIKKQSFKYKKAIAMELGDLINYKFLRKGKIMQWKTELSVDQQNLFKKHINDELILYRYES
jgi:hypothetical protein